MRFRLSLYLIMLCFFLSGCNPPPDLQEVLNQGQPPHKPVVTRLSYEAQSSVLSLSAPFSASIVLYPDFQTGICSAVVNTAQLTLEGTYDESGTKSIEAVGITTQNATLSNGSFSLRICVALGSSAVKIVAIAENKKVSDGVEFSLNLTPSMGTIGFGLAKYPNPGFRVESLAASSTSLSSGAWTAQSMAMSSISVNQAQVSSGISSWNLSLGFVPLLKEVQP